MTSWLSGGYKALSDHELLNTPWLCCNPSRTTGLQSKYKQVYHMHSCWTKKSRLIPSVCEIVPQTWDRYQHVILLLASWVGYSFSTRRLVLPTVKADSWMNCMLNKCANHARFSAPGVGSGGRNHLGILNNSSWALSENFLSADVFRIQ